MQLQYAYMALNELNTAGSPLKDKMQNFEA